MRLTEFSNYLFSLERETAESAAVPPRPTWSDDNMARITVEDCLDHVDNRFDLVLLATKRARQLANGVEPLLQWENDKPTVMALREIADGLLSKEAVAELEQERAQRDAEKSVEQALAEELAAGGLGADVRDSD